MTDLTASVLVVDDDLRIAELHRRFVQKVSGFEVVGIAGGIGEAAEIIEVLQPNLVLLDLFFPEGNGMELLKKIRNAEHSCDVILITAAREIASLQDAVRGGVFDYMIKPVHFPRFREALEKFYGYFCRLHDDNALEQQDIDRLLHAQKTVEPMTGSMPKGIDALTLEKVRKVFTTPEMTELNAEEVGKAVGIGRSTARRYLEFLASEGYLIADLIYGAVGRPERRYKRTDSNRNTL